MKLTHFNFKGFIQDIERKYGRAVAMDVANDFIRLKAVALHNDYLSELDSPRYVIRFKLHPITGKLIIETINDQFKGYRYTFSPSKIHRIPIERTK